MKRSVIYLICIICTMAAIFMFSSENFDNTMKTSDIIVKPIESRIKEKSDKAFDTEKSETDYWKKLKQKLDKVVRKSAHVIIFGLLGMFSILFFISIGLSWGDAIMAAIWLCALYAGSDELHQKFIKGRDCRMEDVCIDTFGAWIGITVIYLADKIKHAKRRRA